MKKTGIVIGIAAFLCMCALLAVPAAAAFTGTQNGPAGGDRMAGALDKLEEQGSDARPPQGAGPGNGEKMTGPLDKLEENGYDVSAIRAAVESGDMETSHELMQEFMTANPDARSPQGEGSGNGEKMTGPLDKLEENGYDVSAIRAAVESGDMETAHELMQEFMTANPDARPPQGEDSGNGEKITGSLDKLEEQGYDVSAIRAAVESGDMETARELMQEFMTANPDARPPQGDGPGNGEKMKELNRNQDNHTSEE